MHADADVISPAYDRVIRKTLILQLFIGVIALLLLDGGITARVVGIALTIFWLSAAVLISRRPYNPTRVDLAFLRWGFWAILAIAVLRQAMA